MPIWIVALVASAAVAAQTAAPQRRPLLDVTSSVSVDRVAPGERFSVSLNLTPAPRVHVYAPEVTGYKPIAFTVRPQPGLVVRGVTFPPSESYYYAPLKETVPVYQKAFRVVQELMLDGSPTGRAALKGLTSVAVQGTLSYQACDDRVCFPPRSVPMTWTIAVKELP